MSEQTQPRKDVCSACEGLGWFPEDRGGCTTEIIPCDCEPTTVGYERARRAELSSCELTLKQISDRARVA